MFICLIKNLNQYYTNNLNLKIYTSNIKVYAMLSLSTQIKYYHLSNL